MVVVAHQEIELTVFIPNNRDLENTIAWSGSGKGSGTGTAFLRADMNKFNHHEIMNTIPTVWGKKIIL